LSKNLLGAKKRSDDDDEIVVESDVADNLEMKKTRKKPLSEENGGI
jgi:hypothetical protein